MRALVQRVTEAHVAIQGDIVGQIDAGLLILACAMDGDLPDVADKLAAKISKLRIFADENGRMNKSLLDVGGAALVVSQFTLAADVTRGNRPGFSTAAAPEIGAQQIVAFGAALQELGIPVATGEFGADMQVHLINDGPVTIWLDTDTTAQKPA